MEVKKKGRKPTNEAAFQKIKNAGSKEVVLLRSEWKLATPPGAYNLRQYLKAEYKVESLTNDRGWVIKKK